MFSLSLPACALLFDFYALRQKSKMQLKQLLILKLVLITVFWIVEISCLLSYNQDPIIQEEVLVPVTQTNMTPQTVLVDKRVQSPITQDLVACCTWLGILFPILLSGYTKLILEYERFSKPMNTRIAPNNNVRPPDRSDPH